MTERHYHFYFPRFIPLVASIATLVLTLVAWHINAQTRDAYNTARQKYERIIKLCDPHDPQDHPTPAPRSHA